MTVVVGWDLDDGGSYASYMTGSLNETDRALTGIVVSFKDERAVIVDLASSPLITKTIFLEEKSNFN